MALDKTQVTKIVGSKIRTLRNAKGLSIEKVALDAGIEYTQLSRIELGKINTSIYQIYKISCSLDTKVPEIFDELNL